jgi:hypothetical protein
MLRPVKSIFGALFFAKPTSLAQSRKESKGFFTVFDFGVNSIEVLHISSTPFL